VESVDDAVGRVRATLDALKLSDNTLVIFTSDNGGLVGPTHNAPLRSGKGHPFEGGIRVPFIVTWPGVAQAGVLSDEPVISMDIKPTIAAAAGVKLPDDVAIDGLNLKAHLKGSAGLDRQTLYWHFPHYRHAPGPYSIIRDGDFKMIKWYEGQTLLFNIKEDIGEATDLAGSMPEKVSELDRKLMAHLRATTDRIPIPNPTFASKP
jgi:arylsulfatase A